MIYIYKGKNPDGYSLDLVATQLADALGGEPVKKLDTVKAADTVINIVFEDTSKILGLRRFVGKFHYIGMLAANHEEQDDPTFAQNMVCYQQEPLVLHSAHSVYEVQKRARALFASAVVGRLDLRYIPWGVEKEFTPSAKYDPTSRERWIVPFNRLNSIQKNVALHAQVTRSVAMTIKARRDGNPSSVFYHPEPRMESAEIPEIYDSVVQPKSRDEYRANARKHGMFLCTSNFESFGIYYLELLLSGCVGIFLDKPWVRKLLPDYPFVASAADIGPLMYTTYLDHAKARAWLEGTYSKKLRELYSLDDTMSEFKKLLPH